ncbi:NAD(P)/FAD-dependent oxidoreductase [Streptomyces sp. NPDC051016]|uniref:NAD(P)/FAD-dependent oxidoreductase n=1 Tax=Streptomyces sp. NPDC051016 TaxID=3365638 RepID=UPI0037BD2006
MTTPSPSDDSRERLSHATPQAFWLSRGERPEPEPRLTRDTHCDLAVVGGGYTGLWTALLAKRRDPSQDVFVLEQAICGHAASGRNGGFCSPSLTHGLANGIERWPHEIELLQRLSAENFDAFQRDLDDFQIDCGFVRSGKVTVAATAWQSDALPAAVALAQQHGEKARLLNAGQLQEYVDSPLWQSGMFSPDYALLDPAQLVWGLRRACLEHGVRIAEHTEVTALDTQNPLRLHTPYGHVTAQRVALATNVYRPLLRRLSLSILPVYDYALVTAPLTDDQLASIGWQGSHGITDAGNQFHYLRKTDDNRILWGGYDAVYHYGSSRQEHLTQRPATFAKLAQQFSQTFPQLGEVPFTHAWGGIIDSSTRFSMFVGTAAHDRVAYALGFTGLGVGATRYGAEVMLDLLSGERTERLEPAMIRRRPVPFPPEPVRYLGVQATRASLAREDSHGRRNLWLRTLDRLGLGFDS